jgi:hypothetical protein
VSQNPFFVYSASRGANVSIHGLIRSQAKRFAPFTRNRIPQSREGLFNHKTSSGRFLAIASRLLSDSGLFGRAGRRITRRVRSPTVSSREWYIPSWTRGPPGDISRKSFSAPPTAAPWKLRVFSSHLHLPPPPPSPLPPREPLTLSRFRGHLERRNFASFLSLYSSLPSLPPPSHSLSLSLPAHFVSAPFRPYPAPLFALLVCNLPFLAPPFPSLISRSFGRTATSREMGWANERAKGKPRSWAI